MTSLPKHHRFRRWLNPKPGAPRLQPPSGSAHPPESADRKRTRERYVESAKLLHDAVNIRKHEWGSFDLPNLRGELEDVNNSQFKEQLDAVLEGKLNAQKDRTTWEQCSYAMQCCFIAFSPFAKNFLSIGANAQSSPVLNPYGLLCGGLMVLITVAEKEMKRKKDLLDTLEYISQLFAQLSVLSILPGDIEERELIVNRALDVRSASMMHLAISIRYESTRLGTLGNVLKVLFVGDEDINDSKTYLERCVQTYSMALSNIILIRTHIKVSDILKGIESINLHHEPRQLENKYLIPYEKNPKLTGRDVFLENLKKQLYMEQPDDFNHRIALFGMGGIGKTQCALGYVYANESTYERIYWITAVDHTSLLLGYQNIAKEAHLGVHSANPDETAKAVIRWLQQEKSWLLIIDNLDDIKIINNLLPANGPASSVTQHTLITTRNPNTVGIPAKPLEVPLLESPDAISLLSKLSGIPLEADAEEREQAAKVAEMLGYLPLALEQAAAYIREVEGNFKSYHHKYLKDHKTLHEWDIGGNRQYQYIVATAWAISFKVVAETDSSAARLLQLFAFLNPDGILIEFLVAGAGGLDKTLEETVLDESKLAKALLELAKMSLIKWDRQKKSISMHRLIQKVVTDYMPSTVSEKVLTTSVGDSSKKSISIHRSLLKFVGGREPPPIVSESEPIFSLASVIGLCNHAFPRDTTQASLCRKYLSQVVEPLLRLSDVRTNEAAYVKYKVGFFLHYDGQYAESLTMFTNSLDIARELPPTEIQVLTMISLTIVLQELGRYEEAAKIGEEAVVESKSIFGDGHRRTIETLARVALVYDNLGRSQEATSILEETVKKCTDSFGHSDFETLRTMHELAVLYYNQRRYDEVLTLETQILEKSKLIHGETDPWTLAAMHTLGTTYSKLKCYAEAREIQEESLIAHTEVLGEEHPRTVLAMECLAITYCRENRYTEALSLHKDALRRMKANLGSVNVLSLNHMHEFVRLYDELARSADASVLEEEVREIELRISQI